MLKVLRSFAVGLLVVGSVAFVGAACGGKDDDKQVDDLQQFDDRTLTPAAESTTTAPATATSTATVANTPTATPTPFNGNVARMKIPSIGVDHIVETVGLENGNQLGTPKNALGAIGWYNIPEYPNLQKPGFGGDAMFSAHVNYNGSNGPFAKLASIQGGDKIMVSMDGGPEYTYQVFAVHGYVVDPNYVTASRPLIDMGKLIDAPDKPAGEEWVTLITCSCAPGRVIIPPGQQFGECLDRDVVLAKRIS